MITLQSLGGFFEIYVTENKKQMSNYKTNNSVSKSNFKEVTLKEYAKTRKAFCEI